MDNLRYRWLQRCCLVPRSKHMSAEDPEVSALYLYCLKGCQEDCGVDGSPGGFDGGPFGMEMLLLVGFGAPAKFASTVAFIPRISTSQTSEQFLLRQFMGTSKPRNGVFTVTFAFPEVDRQRKTTQATWYVPHAPSPQQRLPGNCCHTGPKWVSSGASI